LFWISTKSCAPKKLDTKKSPTLLWGFTI
jgi:hypothetical protein